MYLSKYYTCEEIDQRLLQGYYDDFVHAGYAGTIQEFWAFVLSIANKVDKKDGYGLSQNDFTDELKAKLDGIEEHANYITKVSQLENDKQFQTLEDVQNMISNLVDGADDALDTLKELAEALGNDPNFATTITNKLTELRNELLEEVNRAQQAETDLGNQITQLRADINAEITQLAENIKNTTDSLQEQIHTLETKVDNDIAALAEYKVKVTEDLANAKAEAKAYTDAETTRAKEAEAALAQADHDLNLKHIQDIANLQAQITNETTAREQADKNLTDSLAAEQQARIAEDKAIREEFAKADQVIKDTYVPFTNVSTTELPNRKAIVLPTQGDIILVTGPDGTTYSAVQLNRWDIMDFGNSKFPFNINTPADKRPTIQEAGQTGDQAHQMAYLEDVQKWFGKISIPEQYQDTSVVQLIPALEQSYVDDLGNPDTINGEPYDPTSNNYKVGDPYLSISYFDEALTMHYHLYSASSSYNIGAVFYAMMDYAKKNQEDHDAIRQEIKDSQTSQEGNKQELLDAIAQEAAAREAADKDLDERKVDKVEGYGLSKNDFTDELLQKLNGIEEGANKITALSQLLNDCDFQNSTQVNEAIEKVIGSAPEVLDTLEEIAKALGDDPNFAATMIKKLAAITEDLNEEVERATAAETQLQTNIDNLGTQTDTKLTQLSNQFQQKLDTEAQTRGEMDTQLQSNIQAEAQERQTQDTALGTAIQTEATNRQSADQNLQTQITELATKLGQAGSSLKEYVDQIKATLENRFVQDEALINKNVANIQRNLELIQGLQDSYNKFDKDITDLKNTVTQEIADRQEADKVLQQNIDKVAADLVTETEERKAADQVLQENIDKLKQDTNTKLEELETKHDQDIAAEQQARQEGDKFIQDQIDTFPNNIRVNETPSQDENTFKITFAYKSKDSSKKYTQDGTNIITIPSATTSTAGLMSAQDKGKLEKVITDLATETQNRIQGDQTLQNNIDTLRKTHEDDIEALKATIQSQEQRIQTLETQVQELIDALTIK